MEPNEIDDLVRDLQLFLHRPIVTVQRMPPPLDVRNIFRRVLGAYLAERSADGQETVALLIEIVHTSPLDAEHALIDLDTARRLFEGIGDHEGIAIAVGNMGNVYATAGCYPEALECFARALAIYVNLHDAHGMARCSSNIGTIQVALSSYGRALDILTEALQLVRFDDQLAVFHVLAEAITELESFAASLAIFQRRTLRSR